jgi:WD40 repeat protein
MKVFAALALILLCGCDPRAPGFRNEMRRRSSDSGLALGYIGGSGMEVFPLAGPITQKSLENYSGPCRICAGWFSSDGKLIIWNVLWPDWKPDEPSLLVRTITGQTIAIWSGLLNTPYALALSPDRSRVALEAINHYPGAPATGLQYVVLGTPNRVILEPQPPENEMGGSESVGWSPDSRSIVFSRHGKIIIVNVTTGDQKVMTSGSRPAWSPDGRWISFTSSDGRPMLLDPSSRKEVALYGGSRITGPIAWSPDSCCISFSDHGRNVEDFLGIIQGRMIVYRISDGTWFPLVHFGLKGGISSRFGWFYKYKDFLEINRSNEAKQGTQRTLMPR